MITKTWPSTMHEEYGKLWRPQLILKHKYEVPNWEYGPIPYPNDEGYDVYSSEETEIVRIDAPGFPVAGSRGAFSRLAT